MNQTNTTRSTSSHQRVGGDKRNRTNARKATALALALGGLFAAGPVGAAGNPAAVAARAEIEARYGFVPGFVKALPDNALPGLWRQVKGYQLNDQTALSGKTKELIGLAIATQMPSPLHIATYTRCAQAAGATKAETDEAVTMAAMARHWSTFMNGIQLDEGTFRAELAKLKDNVTKAAAAGTPAPAPLVITDASSALADVQQTFGFVPAFIKRLPPESLPGAWLGFRDVEMSPSSALPGKIKSLVSLAVASQIPCRYCIIADTTFAKLEGATDREITEAVAMAGMARQWIALMDGLQIDEKTYRKDFDRILTSSQAKKHDARAAIKAAMTATAP